MQVFELRYPGVRIDCLAIDGNRRDAETLLSLCETHLADAAVGVSLFEAAQNVPDEPPAWMKRGDAANAVLESRLSQLPPQTRLHRSHELSELAELLVKREEWSEGRLPDDYKNRIPFLHAHTVLYALDGIHKALAKLSVAQSSPSELVEVLGNLTGALPHLVPVRDSAHHSEDRARGLTRKQQPIPPKAISNSLIEAPGGNVLVISALIENVLAYTRSDGQLGEVEISAASVERARVAIQAAIDAFSWSGPVRWVPE